MKITPLDIKQNNFKKKNGRYDAAEVDGFLEAVRLTLEDQIRTKDDLTRETERMKEELDRLRGDEKLLKEAVVSIQQFSEDLKEKAQKEAKLMISEAELEAERTISQAQIDASAIKQDISELIRQRVQFESTMRHVIDAHRKLLEALSSKQFPTTITGKKA